MPLIQISKFIPGGLRLGHLLAALAGVGLLAVLAPAPPSPSDSRAAREPSSLGGTVAPSRPETAGLLGAKRDIFSMQGVADLFSSASWLPPPPPVVAAKPVAPAFPFHFVGTLSDRNGERQVFLAQHGSGLIVTPKVGDMLAGAFKVEAIAADSLSMLYVPLNEKLAVSFASMGTEPGTRQAPGAGSAAAPAPPTTSAPVAGMDTSRSGGAAGGSGGALPPIAGIGVSSQSSAGTTPASATASSGSGTILGSAAPPSNSGILGTGASPVAPGTAPTGPLGTTPAALAPLGTAPTGSGMLGTSPVNPDSSVLFGAKPTSGGPALK